MPNQPILVLECLNLREARGVEAAVREVSLIAIDHPATLRTKCHLRRTPIALRIVAQSLKTLIVDVARIHRIVRDNHPAIATRRRKRNTRYLPAILEIR